MRRKVPVPETDAAAEAFLEEDLSDLDFKQFKPVHFEFEPKSAQLNMRLPRGLLDAVKARASVRAMPYTRYVPEVLEQAVTARTGQERPSRTG